MPIPLLLAELAPAIVGGLVAIGGYALALYSKKQAHKVEQLQADPAE